MDNSKEALEARRRNEQTEQDIARLNDMIRASKRIVFFGGAGVSTESGIPDFRSPNGLYNNRELNPHNATPEEILSHTYFNKYPADFYRFYRKKMLYLSAEPNRAHKKLAELEQAGKQVTVITQNIDGLHSKAGSKRVLELHGSVYRNRCVTCGQFYNVNFVANDSADIPRCSVCGGIVKPDVVLYEECLDDEVVRDTVEAMSQADMLIVAGTSLSVYPAASFLRYFKGKYSVVINLAMQEKETRADLVFYEKVGDILSRVDVAYCTE